MQNLKSRPYEESSQYEQKQRERMLGDNRSPQVTPNIPQGVTALQTDNNQMHISKQQMGEI